MSTELSAPSATPDVIGGSPSPDATPAAGSSPAQGTATSSADVNTQQAVQGESQTPADDPLAGLPSDEDLAQLVSQKAPNAEAVQRLKSAYQPLKQQFEQLQQRFSPFESHLERFEKPEDLQSVLELRDSLIGWETDPQSGQPIPNTDKGAQLISEKYPQHADDLTYSLLGMQSVDPMTGQPRERIDIVLSGMAADPEQRARALQILGGVEPSAVAPQWQPTPDDLAVVALDPANPTPEEKALQDIYRKLPYEEWTELKENSPEYIRRALAKEKLTQDLTRANQETQQREQQRQQQREAYVNQQAKQAADQYVETQLNDALATFHKSVVQQCNFIKPLDPVNLPQGMTPEQATQMNQQIDRANKSEAVQMTATVIGLLNPQVRSHILPLMKEVGLIDDMTLGKIEEAANSFSNNARNYGNLSYRGKLTANGNYQPDSSVTGFSNEANRALKSLVGYANQIRGLLMDTRSSFFELRATEHNATLNGAGAVRPPLNGQGFNPTTVPAGTRPTGWLTRQQIDQQYG